MSNPKAFIEPDPRPYEYEDPGDVVMPSPGFVTDFVAHLRGNETPTIFCVWAALFTLSTALDRTAWIKWGAKKLWPNLYAVLVGEPGQSKKSTTVDVAYEMLLSLLPRARELGLVNLYDRKFEFVTNKATDEAIWAALKPDERVEVQEDGRIKTITRDSHMAMCVSELGTFLSRKKYAMGLIDTITDLYDCKNKDSQRTLARGLEEYRNIYVTMLGAITPDSFERNLPAEVYGEGFMSRLNVVASKVSPRRFPRPVVFEGYPSLATMVDKLVWLTAKADGEYDMDEEAAEVYAKWYVKWKDSLFENRSSGKQADHRRDVNLLKIACLLRAGEYRDGTEITLQNLKDAMRILDFTQKASASMVESAAANDDLARSIEKASEWFRSYGGMAVTRVAFIRAMKKQIPTEHIGKVLSYLYQSKQVLAEIPDRPETSLGFKVDPTKPIAGMMLVYKDIDAEEDA